MERWSAVALTLAVLLAGCGGRSAPPAGIPVDGDGDALPNLEGFVVDEAIRPMEGVTVRILFSDVNATTDADGHYAIHQPTFLAEDVLLSAAAPGYVPRTQQVQMSGHRSTRMDFRLEPDPYQVPHVEVLDHRGTLGCEARFALPGAPGTQSCDVPDVSLSGIRMPSNVSVWAIETSIGLAGAVLQLHWDAESPMSEELHATLRGPVVGCCEGESDKVGSKGQVHADVTGPSPLRLEVPEDAARAFPSWSSLWLEVRLPDGQAAAPVAFSRQQPFDAYATVFYIDAAPPGYMLS